MKTCASFYIFLFFLSISAYSQTIESVRKKLVTDLNPKAKKHGWKLQQSSNRIDLMFTDTFFVNTSISPLNNTNGWSNKLDTLYLRIYIEDNWTQKRYDSICFAQRALIDPLIAKYIAHYDSTNWVDAIKTNKELFLADPYFHLLRWNGCTSFEKDRLKQLTRLPEKIIETIGIFTDLNFKCYSMIEPRGVNIKVEKFRESIVEMLGATALYGCCYTYK